jgi:hypothetical protein
MREALRELQARHVNGGLPAVELTEETRARLSRQARAEETAALLREIVA